MFAALVEAVVGELVGWSGAGSAGLVPITCPIGQQMILRLAGVIGLIAACKLSAHQGGFAELEMQYRVSDWRIIPVSANRCQGVLVIVLRPVRRSGLATPQ